jgi:hypothetical protein
VCQWNLAVTDSVSDWPRMGAPFCCEVMRGARAIARVRATQFVSITASLVKAAASGGAHARGEAPRACCFSLEKVRQSATGLFALLWVGGPGWGGH